jgi:nicotinamidase-related amidase
MSDTPAIDPKRTAVVLIEYQNDFTSEGGTLHGAVKDVMESTGMLKNTADVVEAARAAGATVIHSPRSPARHTESWPEWSCRTRSSRTAGAPPSSTTSPRPRTTS